MIGQRSNKVDVNRFSFLGNIEMNGNDICVGIGFGTSKISKVRCESGKSNMSMRCSVRRFYFIFAV